MIQLSKSPCSSRQWTDNWRTEVLSRQL